MIVGCGAEPRERDDYEICDNGVDDDADGLIDCEDTDCASACTTGEVCDNGVDDDDDGLADCDDPECASACTTGEVCDNGVDDDGDGAVDCADSECSWDPACHGRERCDNGIDDDGDGLVDCEDPICETSTHCREVCDNDIDDNGDGLVDCDDPDCAVDSACREDCENGVDDNDDGLTDCADPTCSGQTSCCEVCDNAFDDDGYGLIDCDDPDCATAPACREICDNGEDDDGDGATDCADPDCTGNPACSEICDNGDDDDGDGLTDCLDPACDFDPACAELCNGEDDDGDGLIDEHPTDPEIGDACYDGPAELAGIGQCEEGEIACLEGALGCLGWVPPLDMELCDGLDNDCDGVVPPEEATEGCGTTVEPGETTRIELRTETRDVDVHFNIDTTGSMGGEVGALRTSLSDAIVPEIREVLPTTNFGVSIFEDFPVHVFGREGDMPFVLHQRITRRIDLVQAAIDGLGLHSGGDGPEAGIESLYQVATGAGTSWGGSSWSAEECGNGRDDDSDGDSDCADPDCYDDIGCILSVAPRVEICRNDEDDDGDGYADCRDPDCVERWFCEAGTPFDCGNDRIDEDEECDDGNTESGDGCDDECELEEGCGNAFLERDRGEMCDDGNREGGDGCSEACAIEAICGDGLRTIGEQCDDGNTEAGDGCDAECLLEPGCGNGVLDPGEECDDGNTADGDSCDSTCTTPGREGVPAFDPAAGFDPALGHGMLGGVGFREGALPIVVHITDNSSHYAGDYRPHGIDSHGTADTLEALTALGARVVGVRSSRYSYSDDHTDLRYPLGWAVITETEVPTCAFDGSPGRASGACAEDECCTGLGGAGVEPYSPDACPLVFEIREDGTGLDESVVGAIDALSRFVRYSLTVEPRDDPSDGVDARCFVEAIEVTGAEGPEGPCDIVPVPTDTDGDGLDDTLEDATPRTHVTFELAAINEDIHDVDGDGDTTEACGGTGSYGLILAVIANGSTVVATRRVEVVVP